MFDPGGVLHAALRAALRRSHECFARGVESPTAPPVLSFPLRCKDASRGTIGGKKRNREPSPLHLVYLFVYSRNPRSADCACDLKQSILISVKQSELIKK